MEDYSVIEPLEAFEPSYLHPLKFDRQFYEHTIYIDEGRITKVIFKHCWHNKCITCITLHRSNRDFKLDKKRFTKIVKKQTKKRFLVGEEDFNYMLKNFFYALLKFGDPKDFRLSYPQLYDSIASMLKFGDPKDLYPQL